MYSKKFLYTSFFHTPFTRSNLNVSSNVKNAYSDRELIKCLCTLRRVPFSDLSNKMNNVISKIKLFCHKKTLYEILNQRLHFSPRSLKDQSAIIIRAWTRQCEYIIAQRFRRTHQMFSLYSRLWEERALKELLSRMRLQVTRHSRELIFGAMGVSAYNWDKQKISDDELKKHEKDFDYVKLLKNKTIICKVCNQRKLVEVMLPNVQYCKCPDYSKVYTHDEWTPYLERKDLIVWRRLRASTGNYEYKLYGAYDDVTADDFLQVQIDTEYRQKWDTTAVTLFVVDTDEKTNSDIIYWEMLWPRMFSNRDYVYNRRYTIDNSTKIITIISKSTEHPNCPIKKDKHRVNNYQSCMVIRPTKDFNKPGIEFCLTYYDDPGVNIPSAVSSWVAIAGMPDFLTKLRIAAKKYRQINVSGDPEDLTITEIDTTRTKLPEADVTVERKTLETDVPPAITITDLPKAQESEVINHPDLPKAQEPEVINHPVELEQNSGNNNNNNNSRWRYIHPFYYLG